MVCDSSDGFAEKCYPFAQFRQFAIRPVDHQPSGQCVKLQRLVLENSFDAPPQRRVQHFNLFCLLRQAAGRVALLQAMAKVIETLRLLRQRILDSSLKLTLRP